jgi:hypothetical protein
VTLPDVSEASGIAASRRTPGIFWVHNDSGQPDLYAVDERGSVKTRIRISGLTVRDWEDIAVGPCPGGSCIYIADIGDNHASRDRITVYRLPEPAAGDKTAPAPEAFHATYPDGPRDAETLVVTTDARIYIVSKGDSAPVASYRFPRALRSGATVQLERVGPPLSADKVDDHWITGGSASPDGRWIALRTHTRLAFYRSADFARGAWQEATHTDLATLDEPQGEGVAIGAEDRIYLVGEGGRFGSGTFARLDCQLK